MFDVSGLPRESNLFLTLNLAFHTIPRKKLNLSQPKLNPFIPLLKVALPPGDFHHVQRRLERPPLARVALRTRTHVPGVDESRRRRRLVADDVHRVRRHQRESDRGLGPSGEHPGSRDREQSG